MKNGLYSIRIEMLDGVRGVNTGVMVLRDGEILGGDAFFFYVGSYSFSDGKWKGEIINREHTKTFRARRQAQHPLQGRVAVFGGRVIGRERQGLRGNADPRIRLIRPPSPRPAPGG